MAPTLIPPPRISLTTTDHSLFQYTYNTTHTHTQTYHYHPNNPLSLTKSNVTKPT